MVLNRFAGKTGKKKTMLNTLFVQFLRKKKTFFNTVSPHNLKTTELILVKFYI
jgi:hypothetical protein